MCERDGKWYKRPHAFLATYEIISLAETILYDLILLDWGEITAGNKWIFFYEMFKETIQSHQIDSSSAILSFASPPSHKFQ